MDYFDLRKKLYDIYKDYKDQNFMSEVFIKTIDSFYSQSDPIIFIKKVEGYIDGFDKGKGGLEYKALIDDWRLLLSSKNFDLKETSAVLAVSHDQISGINGSEINVEKDKEVSDDDIVQPQVKIVPSEIETKSIEVELPVENVNESSVDPIKLSTTNTKSIKNDKLKKIDLTIKTVKIPMSSGLITLLDDNINKTSKDFILSTGVLSDEESMVLVSNPFNTSVLKNHNFLLTRSDLFTMLSLLGLSHLNINISDSLLDEIFDGNSLKIEYFNWLTNANSIELDIQSKVNKLGQLFDKNKSQMDGIEMMLSHLILDRANVPKDKNRDTIKRYLDTSSVMNQNVEAFSVLNGVISSKVVSLKDYKRTRGE